MDKHDKDMLSLAIKYWVLVIGLALAINRVFLFYVLMWLGVAVFFFVLNWVYDRMVPATNGVTKLTYDKSRQHEEVNSQ
jgi:hypothetical protein